MSERANISHEELRTNTEIATEAGVLSVFERWAVDPRAGDLGQASCAVATIKCYQEIPELRDSISFMVDIQNDPDFGPGVSVTDEYLANLWYRSTQHIRLMMNNRRYMKKLAKLQGHEGIPHFRYTFPSEHNIPDAWEETYKHIYGDPHLLDQFEYDTGHRVVQTNFYDRYLSVYLAMATDPKRPNNITWADFGTSIGLGPRGLVRGEKFLPFKAYKPHSEIQGTPNSIPLEIDETTTAALTNLSQFKLPIESVVGFDLMGVNDRSQRLWVKSSHYWKELNSSAHMRRFDRLAGINDHRVNFYQADLTIPNRVAEIMESQSKGKVDYVSILTMRHQLKSIADYENLIANAVSILKPGGKIIESEFMHHSIWPEWSYLTTVREPFSADTSPKAAYVWRNARCTEVIAAPNVA